MCFVSYSVCELFDKQFAIFLDVVLILLLNVMEGLNMGVGALLHALSQYASRCSFHRFCLCLCMYEIISSLRSLRAGLQVFVLLMLFLCVILHTI